MEVIKVLIPMAISLALVFVGLFIWSTLTGQFDDLDTPSKRILLDDDDIFCDHSLKDKNSNQLTHERKDV